jgi:hypothetical protein
VERPTDTLATLAAELAQRVAGMNCAGADASLAEVLDGVTDSDLMRLAEEFGPIKNLIDAIGARVSGVVGARSSRGGEEPLAKRLGERTAAAAIAAVTGVAVVEAADWCRVGEALATRRSLSGDTLPCPHPSVAAALDAGTLCLESARLILETLTEIAPRQSADQLLERERFLVGEAGIVGVAGLRRLCQRLVDLVNPDGVLEREEDARTLNTAKVIHRRNGRYGYVWDTDAEHHGIAQAATTARTSPRRPVDDEKGEQCGSRTDPAVVDTRTRGQRLHDAIGDIFFGALKHDLGDVSGTAVTLLISADHEAILTGIGTATIFGVDEPISAGAARRLACSANILPVIMDGRSVPLDLGEGRRLFSEAQRYALALRDGGCAWPGCPEPPDRCDAAHIAPWRDTRCTDLENGVLFCRFHHRRFDLDGWRIRFQDGVPFLIPPAHIDSTGTPRRCQQRSLPPPG